MGWRFPPAYGKKSNYYEKKIEKNNKKIKSLEEENKIYEEIISKQTSNTSLAEKD